MTTASRRGLRQRLADYFDQRTADADAEAASHGLSVTETSRHGRSYRDPRYAGLAEARAAGCYCVPVCRSTCSKTAAPAASSALQIAEAA